MRKKRSKKKGEKKRGAVFWDNQCSCFMNSFKHFDKSFFNMLLFDFFTLFSVLIIFSLGYAVIAMLTYKILPFIQALNNAVAPEAFDQAMLEAAPNVISTFYLVILVLILTALTALALFCVFNYMAWLSLKKEKAVKKWFWKYYWVNLLLVLIGVGIALILVFLVQPANVGLLLILEIILICFFSFLLRAFFKGRAKECFKQAWSEFKRFKKYILPVIMIILVWLVLLSLLSLLEKINLVIFNIITIIIIILFIGWARRYLFFVVKSDKGGRK
ncbi:hypothetical protein KY348_07270 [Candidatus Woesearchaeota archaeon]|nr:hypothetical protein [Candidatus Woesearchaeota archaeon]